DSTDHYELIKNKFSDFGNPALLLSLFIWEKSFIMKFVLELQSNYNSETDLLDLILKKIVSN
ncbi:hypothetical protein MHK_003144, partial [Candidatus Magnetomorum sp. HK-1]